ncbi:ribonuclease toxin HepT-like protein [Deferrisoma palaeochoriense]
MSDEKAKVLRAELEADARDVETVVEKYGLVKAKLARIEPDEFDYVALAYTISSLYSAMENYFFRVAKAFENRIDPSRWHRHLLERMAIEVPGVRPAVLTAEERDRIDELRAFRHVFRHLYHRALDVEKLQLLDRRVPAALDAFRNAHRRFLERLEQTEGSHTE